MPEKECRSVSDSERQWRAEATTSIGRAAEVARREERGISAAMAKAVTEAIDTVGRFILADKVPYVEVFGRVLPLDQKADDLRNLLTSIGVNAASMPFKYAVEQLKSFCKDHGQAATVRRFSYYDRVSHRLYVSNNDGGIFRPDGEKLQYVRNGTDGVFFLTELGVMPVEVDQASIGYEGQPCRTQLLDHLVLRLLRTGPESPLSDSQARDVMRVWILAALADLPTRPLLLLYGEKDCGKTTAARAVVRALLGPGFDVTVAGGRKDFEAAVTNLPVVFFDNVDAHVKWLQDALAVAATGFTATRRELYTTDRLARFDSLAFVGLTSREALFRRDDVNSRLLVLRLAPVQQHVAEGELLKHLSDPTVRSRLMGGAMRVISEALAVRAEGVKYPDFRMADFAEWGQAVSIVLGQPSDHWARILDGLGQEQDTLLLEGDPLLTALRALLEDRPSGCADQKAGDLYAHLAQYGGEAFTETCGSPEALASQLKRKKDALARHGIAVDHGDDKHAKQYTWTVVKDGCS